MDLYRLILNFYIVVVIMVIFIELENCMFFLCNVMIDNYKKKIYIINYF